MPGPGSDRIQPDHRQCSNMRVASYFLLPPPDALISLETNGIYVFPSKYSYF